ncbi:hypothetical protein ElyMa_006765700, partial [Elysia marginata]
PQSWMTFITSLNESEILSINKVLNIERTSFLYATQPMTVFSTQTPASRVQTGSTYDVTFENILTTSQLGTDYVTFPLMFFGSGVKDTFTIVAVYEATSVEVPQTDGSTDTYDVILNRPGDAHDLELHPTAFHHVTGSKPFYLYARLGGTGKCTTVRQVV